ncbi:polymorphic toxin type 34 domain-containing protein [Escherichia coli]
MILVVWRFRGPVYGDISAKDAKSTQKAWNCRHSRQSNDKKR